VKIALLNLTIEKLIYGGDGIARLAVEAPAKAAPKKKLAHAGSAKVGHQDKPAQVQGKAAFVPFVLEGERIEAKVVEEKPGFVRAQAEKIVSPSPHRIEPQCPYFLKCGGCHYQHTSYDNQLRIKSSIFTETIRRIAKIELPEAPRVHPSPPWSYRNRTRMKVRGGTRFAIGYHRFASHELLPVENCPISSPLINQAIAALWQLGRAGEVPTHVEEIEFFANADDTRLLLEMNLDNHSEQAGADVVDFVSDLRRAVPGISGVALFRKEGESLRHEVVPQSLRNIFGVDAMVYRTARCEYQVSAGSFFQSNRFLTDEMTDLVTLDHSGDYALDLYSGVGLFALPLSQNFREVAAVEAAPYSYHDLRKNSPSNVSTYRAMTQNFLAGAEQIARFDYVVADPPRGGLGENVARQLAELAPAQITYVSCDPATLARDLKILIDSGYKIRESHLIDLFPQTFHIESIVKLGR
jgi:23S rRNA (uracil1939-C5)-methyltransferase